MHEKKVEISFATYIIVNVKQDFSGAFLQKKCTLRERKINLNLDKVYNRLNPFHGLNLGVIWNRLN